MDSREERQQPAWLLASGFAPAVLICAGLGWLWVLLGGVCAALFYIIIVCLLPAADEDAPVQAAGHGSGRGFGRAALLLEALWALFAAAGAASAASRAFPQDAGRAFAGPVLLALAVWAVSGPSGTAARCAAVLSGLLALVFAVLLLAAIPDVRVENLRPRGDPRDAACAFSSMLFPTAALFVQHRGGKRRPTHLLTAFLALLPSAAALLTAGCLSPELAGQSGQPFALLVRSLSLFGVLERFEPLYSAALLLSLFCLCALFLQAGVSLLQELPAFACSGTLPLLLYLPVLAAARAADRFKPVFWMLGSTVFWGIIPILILLVVLLKKVRKKE